MTEPAEGGIYQLGYKPYQGVRLGRGAAVVALYRDSVRSAFGLGRKPSAKIAPAVLIGLAVVPALVQVAVGALAGAVADLIEHSDYFRIVQIILALYGAAVAPEIAGRDQRNRSLALYFSRPIGRTDYALAKYAAIVTAMLAITLVPQLLLWLGRGLATEEFGTYLTEEWDVLGRILAAGLVASALIGAVAVTVAAQTPRRAFATFGIIAVFLVTLAISGILAGGIDTRETHYGIFVAPFNVIDGLSLWLFNATPPPDSPLERAGFDGAWYLAAAGAWTVVGVALLVRRYRVVGP